LTRQREDTNGRINARVRRMIDDGLVGEVQRLAADPRGLNHQASAALGYAEILRHLAGEWALEEAVERIKINTRRFAKNQRTWFKRFTRAAVLDVAGDAGADDVVDEAAGLLELT
jgi:tRNA dimethylallyltransferase